MSTNQFFRANILFLSIFILVGCKSSNDSKANNAESIKREYEQASKNLEANGVRFFSVSDDDSIKITLDFDVLNSNVRNAKSTDEKVKYLTTAYGAMGEFEVKALALLKSNSLDINGHNLVVKKRNMILERSSSVKGLIASHESALNKERAEEAARAQNPYTVKIGSVEFLLCEQDYENPKVAHSKREVLNLKNDFNLVKIVLCSDESIIQKANSTFSKYNGQKSQGYETKIYADTKDLGVDELVLGYEGYSSKTVSIPEHKEALKNKIFDIKRRYDSSEKQINANLFVSLPIFDLLYIAEQNNAASQNFIGFIEQNFINDNDENVLTFFETLYGQKNEILSNYKSSTIISLLNSKFEKSITKSTEEIIGFVVEKNYASLEKYAKASNSNRVSYDRNLKINSSLSAYGLSPLMVAAIINDNRAVEILLAVDQINPNLESPVFKQTYKTINSVNIQALSHLQAYGGSYTGSGHGTGTGSGTVGGSYSPSPNLPQKYRGFTALMIAVYESDCEIVQTIIQAEPHTLNYKTSKGNSALKIAIFNQNKCLSNLLKAGAFDIDLFGQYLPNSTVIDPLEFVRYVPRSAFEDKEVREKMPKILIFSELSLALKKELNKRVPININQVRTLLKDGVRLYHRMNSCCGFFAEITYSAEINLEFDMAFLSYIGFNLAEENIFGEKSVSLFSYVFKEINHHDMSPEKISAELTKFLSRIMSVNQKWVTDWVNSKNSFEGQNPLVAASMFNEVGLVHALLTIEGIDVNVVDEKTKYNALEWQYAINPFIWVFTYSNIASDLKDKGAKIRVPMNVFGTPNSEVKQDMEKTLNATKYPFTRKSDTTTELISK